jgi:hypothetical protein
MNCVSLFMFGLLLNGVASQVADTRKWNTVEILCGKLVRSEEIPIKGKGNSFADKTTPIKRANIRLYLRAEETACCEGQQPAAETVTGREGSFQFNKAVPGDYWIVANIEGKDYRLAISYAPDNKSDAKCSDLLYALKKDQLQLERVITVY